MKYGDVEHDTEDKDWWLIHGTDLEKKFVDKVCPKIGLDGKINPKKETNPLAPDLVVNGEIADLKCQNTPFFTASRYGKNTKEGKVTYDPSYTVTFNRKDYQRYDRSYPEIGIYFWVHWKELAYTPKQGGTLRVLPVSGVWYVDFPELAEWIEQGRYYLHSYLRRKWDTAGNAKESYLIDLNDLDQIALFNK